MSNSHAFRQARIALATVIEELPYGDPLSQHCVALIRQLREHEYAPSDLMLTHHESEACS